MITVTTTDTFPAVLDALTRLNSWVRSPGGRWSGPKKAIYLLKREAIIEAHRRGLTLHRRVYVAVKCRDCDGTGHYESRHGDTLDHCWACDNTGTARLSFVETRIEGGPTWHSPRSGFSLFPVASTEDVLGDAEPEPAGDWTVNQPGEALETWELARDLETAERVLLAGWTQHGLRIYRDRLLYTLDLGYASPDCVFCAGPVGDRGIGAGQVRGSLRVLFRMCGPCYDQVSKRPGTGVALGALPLPAHLVEHPAIRAWLLWRDELHHRIAMPRSDGRDEW